MKKTFIIMLFGFLPLPVFSAIVGSAKVEGIIISYNKTTVTLSQKGRRTTVPRTAIPAFFKIKTGNQVYALFDGKEIREALKKAQKKRKKQTKK